ncbi:MAG TPA: hypothetical protein VLZ83_10210 [Edaphocola sp.]|nr:hypothetical protein [Edaphocola sp.]
MRIKITIILLFFSFFTFAEDVKINFSIGGIGGGVESDFNNVYGFINGDFVNAYAFHAPSKLGLEFSPFHYQGNFVNSNSSSDFNYSIINLTLFHQTIDINEYSILGPFLRINWLDFNQNIPTYTFGIRFCYRDEFNIDFLGKEVNYQEPLLYKFIDVELGLKYSKSIPKIYFGVNIDTSILSVLIIGGLYSEAEKNTEKVKPDYRESLPKREK